MITRVIVDVEILTAENSLQRDQVHDSRVPAGSRIEQVRGSDSQAQAYLHVTVQTLGLGKSFFF